MIHILGIVFAVVSAVLFGGLITWGVTVGLAWVFDYDPLNIGYLRSTGLFVLIVAVRGLWDAIT